MKNLIFCLVITVFSFVFGSLAQAATLPFNTTVHVCGDFHFDIMRVVDGFQIKVTDGARVRTIFHNDVFGASMINPMVSSINTGCYGKSLAIVDRISSKYGSSATVSLLDPSLDPLQIKELGTRRYASVAFESSHDPITIPPQASAQMDELLSREADPWYITRTGLVSKKSAVVEKSDMLNDRSYYVFDGQGGIVRRLANSSWNTVAAKDVMVCGGVAYVLYAKELAEINTATSSYPAEQYIIERSGQGTRKLIPVPYKDGAWKDLNKYQVNNLYVRPYFGRCFGEAVSLFNQYRITMVSGTSRFANFLDPRFSIADWDPKTGVKAYSYQNGYFTPGKIWSDANSVQGSSVIKTLDANGRVIKIKPPYFKNIKSFDAGTMMEFGLDPEYPDKAAVSLTEFCRSCAVTLVKSFYRQTNKGYEKIPGGDSFWIDAESVKANMTPLYLQADNTGISVRSYFLNQPMLLHGIASKFSLLGYRIGPLERDGTRKIWYTFKADGRVQRWMAVVR